MWDRDTPAQDAQKHVDVIESTVGWFDRYPDLYYEMRLKRVSAELVSQPGRLDLYDDAGVACARLGKPGEAIQWMVRKDAALKRQPNSEHQYRYLANLGTFHLQRWGMNPKKNAELADLIEAIRLIKLALVINPHAHFGRERAQLCLMEWWLAGSVPLAERKKLPAPARLREWLEEAPAIDDWPRALQGLIRQGIAWESVDVFSWLSSTMEPELNYLASLRTAELLANGVQPLQPDSDYLSSWAELDARGQTMQESTLMQDFNSDQAARISLFFKQARKAAEARQRELVRFMTLKMQAGGHPDTHADFWKGWKSPASLPALPFGNVIDRIMRWDGDWLIMDGLVYLIAAGFVVLFAWLLVKGCRFVNDRLTA